MEGALAYLIRVYADTSTTGYYSPLHPELGCATLIPIPDPRVKSPPPWLDPWRVRDPCTRREIAWFMPLGGEWPLHRDPRLDAGFYTEPLGRRGRLPADANRGWLLAFASGLAEYPGSFWYERRGLGEIRRRFRKATVEGKTGVYIIALMEVERVVEVRDWAGAPEALWESPHRVYGEPVRAFLGRVEVLHPPIPLKTLESGALKPRIRVLERGRFRLGPLGPREEFLIELERALRRLGYR